MKRIERLFIFLILLYILVTFFELHKKNISQVVTKPVDDRIEENKDHFDRKFGQIIQRFEQLKLDQIIDSDVLAAASRDISQEKLLPNQISSYESEEKLQQLRFATRMVYNRVPKCGSTSLRSLITKLGRWNHFHTRSAQTYETRMLDKPEQMELVEQLENLPEPWCYNRHMHFVNFSEFHHNMPVYINLVRDPVDRFVSRYYHVRYVNPRNMTAQRHNWTINDCIEKASPECNNFSMKYDTFMLIPFFCGYESFCTYPNERALSRAKQIAVKYYVTVGITEKFRNFLELLEYLLPQFFEGIVDFYEDTIPQNVGVRKDILTLSNRKKLQNLMKIEYEFYNFLKGRFFRQLHGLKDAKQNIGNQISI